VSSYATSVADCDSFAVFPQDLEHHGAGVDSVGFKMATSFEKFSQEAAIPIPQDQSMTLIQKSGEKVKSTALKGASQGQIFEPSIRSRNSVEIR